jgi:outer membrane protein assembly factor BamB
MLNMSRFQLVLSVSFLALCAVLSCVSQPVPEQPALQRLVSPELLERAKLGIQWEKKLPIKETERLERLHILGNCIYALSNHNYVTSLNRETGYVIFGCSFAPAGLTILGLELYKDELISVIGNDLVEISPEFGTELRSKSLGFGVTCPAARNSLYFYVAGADRRLHVLRAEDKVKLFDVAAENESMITSIVADDDFVVFATDAGNVISIAPDKPKRLWQFDAADGIVGPIVRDGESLFLASEDTYVYRLNVRKGTPPVWKYQTGALLDRCPRVSEKVVYQYVRYKGLTAIDKKSGIAMWQLPEGVALLAEAKERAYVITDIGTLVVMDNKKAKRLYSVNFARVSKYATNVEDSKIYIADESGRIACLRPVE